MLSLFCFFRFRNCLTARYFDPYDYDVDLDALFAKPAAPPDKVLAKYSWEKTARFWLDEIKKCAEA